MRHEQFDLLVIGGGITGAGIALDAATRGLSVALVEARDIAAGTSSRSSKLIHGGLRYLEMLDFGLVREALRERRLLLTRLAPHLVQPVPFLFPLTAPRLGAAVHGRGPAALRHDGRGPPRASGAAPFEAGGAASAPALRPDALVGAVRFHDAQEDDALYAVSVARTAAAHGAAIATRAAVTGFVRDEGGRVVGVQVRDGVAGETFEVRARHTVAAVGVGTDRVLELATGRPHHELRPSKGVHVLVPRAAIPMRIGLFMRTEKSIFHAIPWGPDHWLLGDTDTEWDGEPERPSPTGPTSTTCWRRCNSVLVRPVERRGVRRVRRSSAARGGGGDGRDDPALPRAPAVSPAARADGDRRRQVHDLPGDGPRRRRRGRRRDLGATFRPRAPRMCRCSTGGDDEVRALAAADPALAGPIPGAGRHVMAAAVHACTHQGRARPRRHPRPAHARRDRGARPRPRRRRGGRAGSSPPVLGWSDARAAEEVARYAAPARRGGRRRGGARRHLRAGGISGDDARMRRFFSYIQRNPIVVSGPCFLIVMVNLTQGVHNWFGIAFVSVWFGASLVMHVRRRRRGLPWIV